MSGRAAFRPSGGLWGAKTSVLPANQGFLEARTEFWHPTGARGAFAGDQRRRLRVVDDAIQEGWLEHIVFRDADRIARKLLPGETLLDRWAQARVGLWLCTFGPQMDCVTERLMLSTLMIVSAEERANLTRRLQLAQINKGPLQGRGWLGTTRFGIRRDRRTMELEQDPEQWPFILRAFELADVGDCIDDRGFSTRKVAALLAEEGCPFDHDRVRKTLKDPIYATGEFSVTVRGVPMAQRPIALTDPVPLDRFQRVQELLALRRGRVKRTPIGEFLLNYVECAHLQCQGARDSRGRRVLIKGLIEPKQPAAARHYRHALCKPESCKHRQFVWQRDEREPPIVREDRRHLGVGLRAIGSRLRVHSACVPFEVISGVVSAGPWENRSHPTPAR